jgi:putative ABC transport system permease protein
MGRTFEIDGRPIPNALDRPDADYRAVTEENFTALGIPLIEGRAFNSGDRAGTQPVVIVSQSMARRHWPDANPIGARIRFAENEPWQTVVGISGDVIHNWFMRRNHPTVYRPFAQGPTRSMALVVRTTNDPESLASAARAAVRSVDRSQPVYELASMRETLRLRTVGLQYVGAIMFVFGGLALTLAVIGIYGVMAYMVTQRTHEIGVRMALGATRQDVLRLTVRQTAKLTAIGVSIGLALAVLLGRLIEAALFGLSSTNPAMVAGLAMLLSLAALAAGYVPARRAASLDPSQALRQS